MNRWGTFCGLLIAVVAGANLAPLAGRMPAPSHRRAPRSSDVVVRQEQRLQRVPAALRAHGVRGPIGYLTDVPPGEIAGDSAAMQEYFIAQFTLAPWVLEAKGIGCEWAIGNFRRPDAGRQPAGYAVIEDLGEGVVLLRRVGR